MKKIIKIILFYLIFLCIGIIFIWIIFKPIFTAKTLIFPYAVHPFDIINLYPYTWKLIKNLYIIMFLISYNIFLIKISRTLYQKIPKTQIKKHHKKQKNKIKDNLKLIAGTTDSGELIEINEEGLYQNIFITGTIGSGKTSSAMYPFTKQLIEYKALYSDEKLAMLILDVKGNYSDKVLEFAQGCLRENDVYIVNLDGNFKYNPLDKPDLKPIVLANRLKTILTLFNKNNSESYWLDKAEQILAEAIKFCRIYNNNYVDFIEIHKLIMSKEYYMSKIVIAREKFKNGYLKEKDAYDLLSCINFFDKEFYSLDERTSSILKSEITRITNFFVSDYNVSKTFCPKKSEITFKGFDEVLDKGKIIVLNMNIAEFKNLSKIIATYLKLDFQSTVLNRLNNKKFIRKSAFICDEFQEYVTDTDADFFSQSREAKCINIIATQSYTSILNTLKDESNAKVIIQNLINKFWFRTDDIFTIEEAQKQIGKEDKEKISSTISENAKETNYSFIINKLISRDTNISESYNKYTQNDFIYDTKFFSQNLKTFTALAFISNGFNILSPQKINMIPYFKKTNTIVQRKNKLKGFDFND